MKGKDIYWPLFLSLVLIAVLLLVGRAVGQVWGYMRLDGRALATVEQWEVGRLGTDRYDLIVHYSFSYKGTPYLASSKWGGKRLLNQSAAEAKIAHLKDKKFYCYFSIKNPKRAQLGRSFPLKASIYALIALGVAVYFAVFAWLIRSSKYHTSL